MLASASAEGITLIYNLALGINAFNVPNRSHLSDQLHPDVIHDLFFLKFQKWLAVPHSKLQRHRFDGVLDERNYCMAGTGQEMWGHACSKCMHIYLSADGNWCKLSMAILLHLLILPISSDYVSAGITDRVTVGHPCCLIHNCTIPLASQQHHFCRTHADHQLLCRIENCSHPMDPGFLTCSDPSHRSWEITRNTANSSMGMLHRQLDHARLPEVPVAGSDTNISNEHNLAPTSGSLGSSLAHVKASSLSKVVHLGIGCIMSSFSFVVVV